MKIEFEFFDAMRSRNERQQVQQFFRRLGWLPALLTGLLANPAVDAATCDPPLANVVGRWGGDGNANDQTGANNGSLQGGATAIATGVVGQCFAFNGSSAYVSIPDSAVAPSFTAPVVQDGSIQFSVSVGPGHNCEIQASLDLVKWQVITNVVADSTGMVQFKDPNPAKQSHCFYRAVLTGD